MNHIYNLHIFNSFKSGFKLGSNIYNKVNDKLLI